MYNDTNGLDNEKVHRGVSYFQIQALEESVCGIRGKTFC